MPHCLRLSGHGSLSEARCPRLAGHGSLSEDRWPWLGLHSPVGLSGAGIRRAGICSPCSPHERCIKQSPAQKGSRLGFVQGWGHSSELEEGLAPHTNDTELESLLCFVARVLSRGEAAARAGIAMGTEEQGWWQPGDSAPVPTASPGAPSWCCSCATPAPRVQAEELQPCLALPGEQPGMKGAWHGAGSVLVASFRCAGENIPGKLQRSLCKRCNYPALYSDSREAPGWG